MIKLNFCMKFQRILLVGDKLFPGSDDPIFCLTWTALPSTTHQMSTGGFESDVEHSKLRLSPFMASLGPLILTCLGPS